MQFWCDKLFAHTLQADNISGTTMLFTTGVNTEQDGCVCVCLLRVCVERSNVLSSQKSDHKSMLMVYY